MKDTSHHDKGCQLYPNPLSWLARGKGLVNPDLCSNYFFPSRQKKKKKKKGRTCPASMAFDRPLIFEQMTFKGTTYFCINDM